MPYDFSVRRSGGSIILRQVSGIKILNARILKGKKRMPTVDEKPSTTMADDDPAIASE